MVVNSLYLLGILKENIGFFKEDNYLTSLIKLGADYVFTDFKQDNFLLYVIVTIF